MALSIIKQTIHYLKLYHINEETPDVAPFEDIVKNYKKKILLTGALEIRNDLFFAEEYNYLQFYSCLKYHLLLGPV